MNTDTFRQTSAFIIYFPTLYYSDLEASLRIAMKEQLLIAL